MEGITSVEHSVASNDTGNHPVHLAAREGNLTEIQTILSSQPNLLELRNEQWCTPLHCAICADGPETVRFLLEKGADPTSEGGAFSGAGGTVDSNDAITMAAVLGKPKALQALLEFGLQVPKCALLNAAALNRVDSIRSMLPRLIECWQDKSSSMLHEALKLAAMCWHVETTHSLLCEIPGFPDLQKVGDQQALHRALGSALEDNICPDFCRDGSSRRRQFLTVKELVAAGGDLSKFSIWSALNPLLGTAHDDIGRELGILMLDQGADVSVVDRTGCTPLAVAVADRDNDTSLVSALLATGADMSSDSDGNTPLHHVYQPDILKLLLQTSQTSMKRNNMGWTPLIAVAGNNEWRQHLPPQKRIEVCALMLSHGCDINASAINGITALHRAVMFRDDDVAAFLLEKGADVGLLTDRDQSALHFACMAASFTHWMWADSDYENIILLPVLQNLRLLLSSGSDLEARDIDGRTPIFYTLREYVPETKRPDPGEWATEYDLTRNKDHFTVFAEVCNLLCAEGANIQAQDSSGRTIRDLIDTRSLKTPVAGLKPT